MKTKNQPLITPTEIRNELWDLRKRHYDLAIAVGIQEPYLSKIIHGKITMTQDMSDRIRAAIKKLGGKSCEKGN